MTAATARITPNIIAEHGLTAEEYQLVLEIMGREPSMTERDGCRQRSDIESQWRSYKLGHKQSTARL